MLIWSSPSYRLYLPRPRSQQHRLRSNLRDAVSVHPPRAAVIRRIRVHGPRTNGHLSKRGGSELGARQMDDQDLCLGRRVLFLAPVSRYVRVFM